MEFDPVALVKQADHVGKRIGERINQICLNFLLLVFGPGLVLIGLHALPPPWRPGLDWPIHGEQATATLQSVHLALRHPVSDARIDNAEVSTTLGLDYVDGAGKRHAASLAGPWMMQTGTQWSGDAVWLYLDDIARTLGAAPLTLEMPADIAKQLSVPHEEFAATTEKTAGNLDRPLRWIAFGWLAPRNALKVRFDPRRPDVAIPEALIERESTRLQGPGVLRAGAFALGCLLVGVFAWRVFSFSRRGLRLLAALLAVSTVLWWSPYVGSLVRIVVPGIGGWQGVDIDQVVADPLAGMVDEFRAGPYYVAAKTPASMQGVAWSPDDLSAHALMRWLHGIAVVPVQGSLEDAEAALARAAAASLPMLDEPTLRAVGADLQALSLRRYWTGAEHYVQLRDAVRTELQRRGLRDVL